MYQMMVCVVNNRGGGGGRKHYNILCNVRYIVIACFYLTRVGPNHEGRIRAVLQNNTCI